MWIDSASCDEKLDRANQIALRGSVCCPKFCFSIALLRILEFQLARELLVLEASTSYLMLSTTLISNGLDQLPNYNLLLAPSSVATLSTGSVIGYGTHA